MRLLQFITKKRIVLPFYHTVAEHSLSHIKHLYRMKTVTEFRKDLEFLLKNYQPIDMETLYHLHINKVVPKKTFFHLTFDDGLKEAYEVVAPILLEKGVPATFFVNSAFVNNKALFYRYHASLSIENLSRKGELTDKLKTELLMCQYQEREKLFQYFSPQQVADFLNTEQPYLTAEQIQTLSKQGFTIGAHSIDHPYYHQIPLAEQLRQTRESLDFVATVVNQKLRLFAFPFTDFKVSKDFFKEIQPDVDLCFGTANLKNDEIPFNLQRVAGERDRAESMSVILRKEYLKYLVRRRAKEHR